MPLRLFSHSPVCVYRISKLDLVSRYSSIPKSEEVVSLWFVKVVCTLHVRRKSSVREVLVLDYLRENLNSPTAFCVIKHLHSSWNHPKSAFSFLEYTKNMNLVHSIETYSFLLRSFCQVGVHDLAKLVIDLMKIDGLFPNSSLLGSVITSFVNAGKLEAAKELIVDHSRNLNSEMLSSFVINKLLSSLVKNNQVDEAVSLFENIISRSQHYYSDTYTFNIVISSLCRTKKVYKAHELLKQTRSPDVVSFTSVISGYCKLGKMKDALVLFDNMIDHGIKPNTITFNIIINGFGKIRNTVGALKIYEKMVNLGCTPDVITFTSIIDGYCRAGELPEALKIWDEMKRRNLHPNLHTFSILIHSLCEESKLLEARDLLRQLRKRGDIVCKAFVYNPVIDGYCKAGNVDEANMIVKEMEEKRCKLDKITYTILIIGHCMKGRMVEAIGLFEKMLIVGCVPDSVTINSLVSRLLKAGMHKEAFEIRKAGSDRWVPQTDFCFSKDFDITVAL